MAKEAANREALKTKEMQIETNRKWINKNEMFCPFPPLQILSENQELRDPSESLEISPMKTNWGCDYSTGNDANMAVASLAAVDIS